MTTPADRAVHAMEATEPGGGIGGVASTLELHREQVVCRLLAGGISEPTLRRILPEWAALIEATAASR